MFADATPYLSYPPKYPHPVLDYTSCPSSAPLTNFPGSTSDHLAWEGCCFKRTIEKEGYLAALLCLFGDNAY